MDVRHTDAEESSFFLGWGGALLPPIKKLTRSTTDPTTPNCLPSTMDEEELLLTRQSLCIPMMPLYCYSYISPPSASRVLYTFPILFWNTYKYMWHVHTTWIASHAINLACDRSGNKQHNVRSVFQYSARTDGSRITTTPPSRADGNKAASPRKYNNDPLLGREVIKIPFDNFLRSSALCMES